MLVKVICVKQAIFTCPFCNDTAWFTRIMLWKHIGECMKKTPSTVELFTENEAVIAVTQ
jgi:hypothetical protein